MSEVEGKAIGWNAKYIDAKWVEEVPVKKVKKSAAKTKKPAKKKAPKTS